MTDVIFKSFKACAASQGDTNKHLALGAIFLGKPRRKDLGITKRLLVEVVPSPPGPANLVCILI